jgi:hypothetical protein
MTFSAPPEDYLLSAAVALAWLLGCRGSRVAVRLRVVLAGLGLSILCFPVGVAIGRAVMPASHCTAQDAACSSGPAFSIWMNGFLALNWTVALAALTFALETARTVRRHLREGRAPATGTGEKT